MKKWQCTICGYIHTGDEPPDICPVCGADKSKFVEEAAQEEKEESKSIQASADNSTEASAKVDSEPPSGTYAMITKLMIKHHIHPVSVHFPNGVVPVAVLFIFMGVIFQFAGLAKASFYNMVVVLLSMPLVLFSGFNEWKQKYQQSKTSMFIIKIVAALVVTAATVIIVLWHIIDPDIINASSASKTGFMILHLIMLAGAGIAGFIGGKLVFKD